MTLKSIYLPIVFHFHQPVDNFPWVYEDCFKKAYSPLIDNIFNYPEVKVTLHFSGNLLEWFLEKKLDFIEKLKIMARRGQIELIGGGYYEPIFAIIPYRDKIAQIKKLSNLIQKEFKITVKGAWLSERVYEPNYPSFLNDVGLKYIIVDDNHFRSTGITEEGTLYSYITEDEGKTLRVFPINEELRYLTPWKPTYLSIDYLKTMVDEKGDRIALLISDAEKMGVWGSTHEICYKDGHWDGDNRKPFIPAFFEQIIKNKWIKSITLSEYMEKYPARGLIYLPTASYDKMEEWVLPTKIRKNFKKIRKRLRDNELKKDKETYQFLKGGFWRYFLVKYPESNNMHKKMLYVREKLIQTENQTKKLSNENLVSTGKEKISKAWDEIYKAQCNDSYWHGLFGGVYLQFLRFSVYTHLIKAENLIDQINSLIYPKLKSYITITPIDFNKDSKLDLIIESNVLNLYLNPSDGGTIFELDFKPKSYNLLNTLTRWYEAYHKDEKIESKDVMIDRYRRTMLRLRFFHDDVSFEQIQEDKYYEFGDFVNGEFKVTLSEKEGKSATVNMEFLGSVKDTNSDNRISCLVSKNIFVEENSALITISGTFINTSGQEDTLNRTLKHLKIGIDIPFFFNGDPNRFQWESSQLEILSENEKDLLSPFSFKGNHFKAYDESYDLAFELMISTNMEDVRINKFPIIAYAYTGEGYQKIYQGLNVTPVFKLNKIFEIQIQLKIY